MLYILPPPRAPNPPSPWDVLCHENSSTTSTKISITTRKRISKLRLTTKIDDGATRPHNDMETSRSPKSLSECYFAGKGTALVLPDAEAHKTHNRRAVGQGPAHIQKHLQSMFYLLHPVETLKMAVKLESIHPSRTRYLVVVSRMGSRGEESCLLGIDCNEKTTVGLVLRVLADTTIRLDGDGGFSVSVCGRHHIFKPVSVQAMWSALQTLHKVSLKAQERNYFQGALTHSWVNYYEDKIESDQSCLNEWNEMDNLESRRPASPDSIRTKPREREETEVIIRTTLKEIMMSVDLDEVTSKQIRSRLEEDLDVDLGEYKPFIDKEIIKIFGQIDAPSEIFEHVFLGSEWNASNYDELLKNGVGHILNVTREIDNFFPGTFDYCNIRVYDDENTDLLKHWDDTFKYITKAKSKGSKVLVHCKMGVSRSASVVIAYAMKAFNMDFKTAFKFVKEKRTCIKPNSSFLGQLETYQGILDAMKNKEKLQRSKSETNLKIPKIFTKSDSGETTGQQSPNNTKTSSDNHLQTTLSGQDLRNLGSRPKSWSPEVVDSKLVLPETKSSPFLSLEDLSQNSSSKEPIKNLHTPERHRNRLMPCDNGESYSVTPNQIMHLPGQHPCGEHSLASVKERIIELEQQKQLKMCKSKLVLELNVNTLAEPAQTKPNEQCERDSASPLAFPIEGETEPWDPGEDRLLQTCEVSDSASETVWTSSTVLKSVPLQCDTNKVPGSPPVQLRHSNKTPPRKNSDPFSNQLDCVFDKEEKRQVRSSVIPLMPENNDSSTDITRDSPSRQNSWSSYDSAVVISNNDTLSRNNSWGSGDNRTLPSRNSSWNSYDMLRRNTPVYYTNEKNEKVLCPSSSDISTSSNIWGEDLNSGTVKRTKQKLEDNSINSKINKEATSAIPTRNINIPKAKSKNNLSRLSISAPCPSTLDLVGYNALSRASSSATNLDKKTAQVKPHKVYMDNLQKEVTNKTSTEAKETNISGIVKSRKMEYEAKTGAFQDNNIIKPETVGESLPASPVLSAKDHKTFGEERNFKILFNKFEKERQVRQHQISILNFNKEKRIEKRPPIHTEVAATVIATAVRKKQFGKNHPVTRLNNTHRHLNTV